MAENPTGPTIDEGSTDVAGIVEDMGKSKAVAVSGDPYSAQAVLGDDAPSPPEPPAAPNYQDLGLMGIVADSSAWIKAQPAETVDETSRPGLTSRGWSPEVTARHPKLVAATMEELAGGAGEPSEDIPISNLDEHKTWLRNAAIQLNYKRLIQGLDAFAGTSPEVQAAFAEAVAEAQATASTGTSAPTPTPTSTPTDTSTNTSSRTSSRTASRTQAPETAPVPPPPPPTT